MPSTGERPYLCVEEDCRRAFTTNYSRKTHMLVHKRRTSSSASSTSSSSTTTYTMTHTSLVQLDNHSSSTTSTTTAIQGPAQEAGEERVGGCSQGGDVANKDRVRKWVCGLHVFVSLPVFFFLTYVFPLQNGWWVSGLPYSKVLEGFLTAIPFRFMTVCEFRY